MLLQTYKTLDNAELQTAWLSMETHDVSPFCYLDYMRYVYAQVKYASAYSPRILTVKSDDGAIQMIVPTKFDHFKRAYRLLGDIQGCGHPLHYLSQTLRQSR